MTWDRLLKALGGYSSPHYSQGIEWVCVGQNASHEFYLGRDLAGNFYRRSPGEGELEDGSWGWVDDPPRKIVEKDLDKILATGYFGHH